MPRPLSWLPRLHEIRRAVSSSVRSHYGRRELEALFELQPRAAQMLLGIVPTVQVGTSRLVEREALASFLDGVNAADDPSSFIEQVRSERAGISRQKIRTLVQTDVAPVALESVPDCITLSRGQLGIRFQSVEQLAQAMYMLARILETDGDRFAREFVPERRVAEPEGAEEIREMFRELEQMEAASTR